MVVGSWLPRIPEIRDRLALDLGALGVTLALGGVGSLLGSSLSGVTVGRLGARRTAIIAAAFLYLSMPLISVAPTAYLLAATLAVMGFVDAQADVGMNAVGIRVEVSIGRSIMTRLHGLWSLGTLVGSGISALALMFGVGLGPHLTVVAVAGLIVVVVAARLIPEQRGRARLATRSGALALGLVFAGGTAVLIEGTPFDWSAVFLTDVIQTAPALAGAGVIVYTAGMLGGRLAGDHLVDRFSSLRTLISGFGVSIVGLFTVVIGRSAAWALVGFALWGLGISVALPVLYKLAGSHPSFTEGSGLAALTVGTRLGFMVSPALIGMAAGAWSLPTAIAVVVGMAAVASTVAIRLTMGRPVPVHDSLP
jgi:predicted MFS family arabinose efflux permease